MKIKFTFTDNTTKTIDYDDTMVDLVKDLKTVESTASGTIYMPIQKIGNIIVNTSNITYIEEDKVV